MKRGVVLSPMELPQFIRQDEFLIWDWTKVKDRMSDWGYNNCSTNIGHRRDFILPYLKNLEYTNSGFLEGQFGKSFRNLIDKPLLLSFNDCKTIALPLNAVADGMSNPHGELTTKYLNDLYLEGKETDLQSVIDSVPKDAYMTYDFSKIKIM
jgi:hypothetical protein